MENGPWILPSWLPWYSHCTIAFFPSSFEDKTISEVTAVLVASSCVVDWMMASMSLLFVSYISIFPFNNNAFAASVIILNESWAICRRSASFGVAATPASTFVLVLFLFFTWKCCPYRTNAPMIVSFPSKCGSSFEYKSCSDQLSMRLSISSTACFRRNSARCMAIRSCRIAASLCFSSSLLFVDSSFKLSTHASGSSSSSLRFRKT